MRLSTFIEKRSREEGKIDQVGRRVMRRAQGESGISQQKGEKEKKGVGAEGASTHKEEELPKKKEADGPASSKALGKEPGEKLRQRRGLPHRNRRKRGGKKLVSLSRKNDSHRSLLEGERRRGVVSNGAESEKKVNT